MTEQDVLNQLHAYGLRVDNLSIGCMTRVKVEGSRGEPGWYVIYQERDRYGDDRFFGSFGNWKDPDNTQKIEFDSTGLSDEERTAFKKRMEDVQQAREAERLKLAQQTAKRAAKIWLGLPDQGKSDYLDRKRVRAFGVRFSRGSIVVPLVKDAGQLVGLQFIAPDGGKKFLTGTAKRGAYHLIGEDEPFPPVVLLAEGYATAASLFMATGKPVAVCFDAGNLKPVAHSLRQRWPEALMVVCCDDDTQTDGNPGKIKGEAAARSVGGYAVIPRFRRVVGE